MRPVLSSLSRAGNHGEKPTREAAFELRKRFSCFTAEEAELLTELRPAIESEAEQIIERFYDHLMDYDAIRPLLAEPRIVRSLKQAQRTYLVSLTSGQYDQAYADSRLLIGRIHEKIGLEPQWYLGTYGFYIDTLIPLVHRHYAADPSRATRATTALSKVMLLDMQVVLDAYYETREQKAVAHSEQLAAVGELAASIAHEVRNPLAGMKGALEILRTELAVKPSNLEIVDELLAQIVRMEGLVRDLLTYARPRALAPTEVDLHDLLDRLLRTYKDQADQTGITIERVYGPGSGRIVADLQQLEQVLLNLIHNAFQAMEDGGTLTVSTKLGEREVKVSMEDTGKGIAPADLPRIFQPFFTTKHRGSGLGLSIVRKIIEAHRGEVEVLSEVGHGTCVTLGLPQTKQAV